MSFVFACLQVQIELRNLIRTVQIEFIRIHIIPLISFLFQSYVPIACVSKRLMAQPQTVTLLLGVPSACLTVFSFSSRLVKQASLLGGLKVAPAVQRGSERRQPQSAAVVPPSPGTPFCCHRVRGKRAHHHTSVKVTPEYQQKKLRGHQLLPGRSPSAAQRKRPTTPGSACATICQ